MSQTRISQLAASVGRNTAIVDDYIRENGLPTPSFDEDAPIEMCLPPEAAHIEAARKAAIAASIELTELLQGPKTLLSPPINGTSLQAIYKYEIASKVPIHGTISYDELALQCKLPVLDLRRIIRYAISFHRVFCEPKTGYVAHSAGSRHLAESSNAHDMCGLSYDECWQAMAKTVEALQKYGDVEPNHTGHALSEGTEDNFFEWIGKNPAKARRFAGAMGSLTPSGSVAAHLCSSFDWGSINGGIVVDVGGSRGGISIVLAEAFPNLKFIVQDLPEAQVGAREKVPPAVADRISFQPHDFFTEQSAAADVYFFRAVFHDWPDEYCLRILKQTIPALKEGAYVVINDSLVPEPDRLGLLEERNTRAYDMLMMTLCNGREREENDWINLFKEASPNFKLVKAVKPQTGLFGVIVFQWSTA